MRTATAAPRFAAIAAGALAAVAAALVTQYGFGMQPCPWCVLQRLIFLAIVPVAAVGAVWRSRFGRTTTGLLVLALAVCGAGSALWQHFRAAVSASCNLTLADRIVSQWLGLDDLVPTVFAPRASCADAAVPLLGIPYDFWSLALYVVIAWIAIRILGSSATDRSGRVPMRA